MRILRTIKNILLRTLLFLAQKVPKKKNLILFGSWFGEKYMDNSMYLFEYMLKDPFFKIYWVTRNKEVYSKLISEKKPVILSESILGVLMQLRAKVMIATVDKLDFNPYFIGGTVFINLGHGVPLKKSGFDRSTENEEGLLDYFKTIRIYNKFNYNVLISSSQVIIETCKTAWRADEIVSLGVPRNDIFYNHELLPAGNILKSKYKKNRKAIVYMPTHRNEGKTKISVADLFDLKLIEEYCLRFDYIFVVKKHYYHKEEIEDFSLYSMIIDITKDDINPQVLLFETDILITDYSSCFFDYLLLDRPIMFYCFDLFDYETNRGVYFNYEDIMAGPKSRSITEFNEQLLSLLENRTDEYFAFREKVRNMFFDKHNQREVCPQISSYIREHYI